MASITDYLRDFTVGEPSGRQAAFAAFMDPIITDEDHADARREPDIDVVKAEAYREGRDEAEAELSARHAEALAGERERHAAELESLRAEFTAKQAANLAAAIELLGQTVADRVAHDVADILSPVLDAHLTDIALKNLAALIAETVRERDAVHIAVTGPRALFDMLSERLGERAGNIAFTEGDMPGITADIDGQVLASRLGEWRSALEEAFR